MLLAQHLVHLADERLLVHAEHATALLDVERTQDLVRHERDALHDLVDGCGLLHRIVAHLGHEQARLEHEEVLRVALQVFRHFGTAVALREAVRILALGEGDHLHVEAFLQHEVDPAQACLHARRIAIVEDGDHRRVALDQAHLLLGEAGAAAGHHVGDARLVQTDHIGVALHQIAEALLHDALLRVRDAVERAALVVEHALRTVEVLRELLVALERARTETDGLAAEAEDGEGDTTREEIPRCAGAIIAPLDPARFLQHFRVEAVGLCSVCERIALLGHVTELEGLDGGIAEAAFVEVREADAFAFVGVPQLVHAPVERPLLHHGDAFTLALLDLLFGCLLFFRQVDGVALGQPPDRLHVAEVLVLLQEFDGITRLATTEALVDTQVGTDVERRRLLVVERTESQIARTLALERHEIAHDLLHAHGVLHGLDGLGRDH